MVPHHRLRRVDTAPSCDARAQSQLGVISVGEEIFIEPSDLIEHLLAIQRRAPVRPQDFLLPVELPGVERSTAPPAVLAIRKNEVPGFIDNAWVLPDENFAGRHANVRRTVTGTA